MNVDKVDLAHLPRLHSASCVEEEQFLAMRAVWPERRKAREFPGDWVNKKFAIAFDSPVLANCRRVLEDFEELNIYIKQLKADPEVDPKSDSEADSSSNPAF